jgi:hypothetical protein
MLQGRVRPERCSIGWHATGAIRQWIRNLKLTYLVLFTVKALTSPNFILDLLNVAGNESGTLPGKGRCVVRHSDSLAHDRNHKLELIVLNTH